MNDHHVICPHCGFLIPITGAGSKTVVKVDKPRTKKLPRDHDAPTLPDILQDHYEAYWKVATIFGKTKNFKPSDTANLYMEALKLGATDEMIFTHAFRLSRQTSEQKYLPQFAKWLEGLSFLPTNLPPEGMDNGELASSRLAPRARAE